MFTSALTKNRPNSAERGIFGPFCERRFKFGLIAVRFRARVLISERLKSQRQKSLLNTPSPCSWLLITSHRGFLNSALKSRVSDFHFLSPPTRRCNEIRARDYSRRISDNIYSIKRVCNDANHCVLHSEDFSREPFD